MYCWKCGEALDADTTFCPRCGGKVKMVKNTSNWQEWREKKLACIVPAVLLLLTAFLPWARVDVLFDEMEFNLPELIQLYADYAHAKSPEALMTAVWLIGGIGLCAHLLAIWAAISESERTGKYMMTAGVLLFLFGVALCAGVFSDDEGRAGYGIFLFFGMTVLQMFLGYGLMTDRAHRMKLIAEVGSTADAEYLKCIVSNDMMELIGSCTYCIRSHENNATAEEMLGMVREGEVYTCKARFVSSSVRQEYEALNDRINSFAQVKYYGHFDAENDFVLFKVEVYGRQR